MNTEQLKEHYIPKMTGDGLEIIALFEEPGNGIVVLADCPGECDQYVVVTYWEDGRFEPETVIGERQARIAYALTVKEVLIPAIHRIDPAFACPSCDEDDMDRLNWVSDTKVQCLTCRRIYKP